MNNLGHKLSFWVNKQSFWEDCLIDVGVTVCVLLYFLGFVMVYIQSFYQPLKKPLIIMRKPSLFFLASKTIYSENQSNIDPQFL